MSDYPSPLKAIRKHCMDCSGTTTEVRLCTVITCWLHPYRFGKNPYRKKRQLTDEQKQRLANQLAKGREKRKTNGRS